MIPAGAFEYVETRRLHLSSNNISYIDNEAFRGLETALEYLNLENNGLTHVPSAVSRLRRMAYLYLSNNDISTISTDAFDAFAGNLRALSLSNNHLGALPVEALGNCQKLVHFNVGYNKITHIFPGDFEWAKSLEVLLLRNNVIAKLKAGTFKGARRLKELSLSFNHLAELDGRAFMGIEESLEILEMSFAFSTDVMPKVALSSLRKLLWLVLDNNNFHVLDADTFYSFRQLRYVNLESNRLHYLPDKVFIADVHQELQDVKFGYNFVEAIPEATFHNLTELRSLDLTGNRIQLLATGSIVNCSKLVTVSLAYNRITVMQKSALHGLASLRFLHLEFNDLTALDLDAIADSGGPEFSLNVSFNSISVINYEVGVVNLTSLDLACNNISVLAGDTFEGVARLRSLDLRGNYLTTVHPGM